MPTSRETILQALLAALQSVPAATVLRGAILPERIPTGGLLILRDKDPGTPEVTLSPLVFDLEHEQVRRIQLVQTGERDFEVRIQLAEGAAAGLVFNEVIESVKRVFRDNGLNDVTVRAGEAPSGFTASGKFHEVVPLRSAGSRT